jgi:hypothetical protein
MRSFERESRRLAGVLQIAGEEELPHWQVFTFEFGIPDGGSEDARRQRMAP